MARIGLRQVLCSLLVLLALSPVVLATGSQAFRLPVYDAAVLGVPVFPLMVLGILLVLLVLVWVFAAGAFGEADGEDRP